MPAQGNIALREKQGRKEQPCCSLGGCEGLTLPGSSRGAQPYGCMPTIQYVTPIQDQGPSRSAAWQPQRNAQASGYHSLKGYTPEAFSISRDPWVFLLCQLMSDTTACGFWEVPPAPPALLWPLCWCGGKGAGLNMGEAGKETALGHCRKRYSLPGASWRDSLHLICFLQHGKRRLGGKPGHHAGVLPHGCSLQSLGQHLPP